MSITEELSLPQRKIKVPRTLFEARKMAGSATTKRKKGQFYGSIHLFIPNLYRNITPEKHL